MNICWQETFHCCIPIRIYLYPYRPFMMFSVRYIYVKTRPYRIQFDYKNGITNVVFANKDYGISRPEIKKAQRRL